MAFTFIASIQKYTFDFRQIPAENQRLWVARMIIITIKYYFVNPDSKRSYVQKFDEKHISQSNMKLFDLN